MPLKEEVHKKLMEMTQEKKTEYVRTAVARVLCGLSENTKGVCKELELPSEKEHAICGARCFLGLLFLRDELDVLLPLAKDISMKEGIDNLLRELDGKAKQN